MRLTRTVANRTLLEDDALVEGVGLPRSAMQVAAGANVKQERMDGYIRLGAGGLILCTG